MFNFWYLNEYGEQRVRRANPTTFKRLILVCVSLILMKYPIFLGGSAPELPMVDALTQLVCDRGLLVRLCEGSIRNPPPFDWPLVVEEHERIYREASGSRG